MIRNIKKALGRRSVYWAGLRADDISRTAGALPHLAGSFSIMGGRDQPVPSVLHEDLSSVRVDADRWDISSELRSPATIEFRSLLLRALTAESALVPYRSSEFLSAIAFARRDTCVHLGLFGGIQSAFEHKPWVESELQAWGVDGIPWIYLPDEEASFAGSMLTAGPILVRRSRSSGGEGLRLVRDETELRDAWPASDEGFAAVAPFLDGALPLNIGGTVWHDGVSIGRPSVQLIGIPACTGRQFGYCGNDFARAVELDAETLRLIEQQTRAIGEWLRGHGYLGSFGVDSLLTKGALLFTEVNPRFQGSTHLAARISESLDESCLYLDHIGACLGFDCPQRPPLADRMRDIEGLSHVIVHWSGPRATGVDVSDLVQNLVSDLRSVDLQIRPSLVAWTGAPVARLAVAGSVTSDGYSIERRLARPIEEWQSRAVEAAEVR
jgi:hypothetical protein